MAAANDSIAPPVSREEAEALARRLVGEYVRGCRATMRGDIAANLTLLVSLSGYALAHVVGSADAATRMHLAAQLLVETGPAAPIPSASQH